MVAMVLDFMCDWRKLGDMAGLRLVWGWVSNWSGRSEGFLVRGSEGCGTFLKRITRALGMGDRER